MRTDYELRKFVVPEFIIGTDARKLAGRYAKNLSATHVFLVTGPQIIKAGWVLDVIESLAAEGIRYTLFSDVSPNPRDFEVMNGADLYTRYMCDAIIVIGGGSPIDCAKGIGIVVSGKKNILEFEGVDKVEIPPPPLICIPTTAGSAADVSQFAIINDVQRRVKIAIISKKIVPDISLIDPVPLTSLSPELTAHTGMDALTHSIEAYVSDASSPVTDLHALESISLIYTNLLQAYTDPKNLEFRYKTMLGSLLAGLAFSNASLGAVHAMAHSLGGYSDLPHGQCNSLLLEHVITYNYEEAQMRYDAISEVIKIPCTGCSPSKRKNNLINALKDFRMSLGIHETFRDLGITQDSIPELAKKAILDPCMATNPRKPVIEDIEHIYEAAL